jgi:hypothetical protein
VGIVNDVQIEPEALDQVQKLSETPHLHHLFERVDEIIGMLEENHTQRDVRRRSFRSHPTTWGVPVRASGENWIVLWQLLSTGHSEVPVISYIGPGHPVTGRGSARRPLSPPKPADHGRERSQ